MAVYPPLKFIEQMERYFQVPNQRGMESVVNMKAINLAKTYMNLHRSEFFSDYGSVRDLGRLSNDVMTEYQSSALKFTKALGLSMSFDSISDFFDLMLYYDTREIWRYNKLSYIVDESLFDNLLVMDTPKLAPMDCLSKLPANCFYIDYNQCGDKIMKDLRGTFVNTSLNGDELNIVLVHLINSNSIDRVLLLTSVLRISDINLDKFGTDITKSAPDVPIVCEDGVTRVISESKMWHFLLNFLIYLQASNRDVVVSERTRKNHEKSQKVIKNKFREVKEFEVGFVYGKTISKDAERVRYVGENSGKDEGVVTRPVSSHYRSAHWHHYWTGSGDNKELIIKWVDGVFVKGSKDEAENVVIHKVK